VSISISILILLICILSICMSIEGSEMKQALTGTGVQDFKYLKSWCSKERDIKSVACEVTP